MESPQVGKNEQKSTTQTVTIENRSIPVTAEDIPLDDVKLDHDNPRIRENLKKRNGKSGIATQKDLQKMILELPGVSSLQRSIRDNKGLHERIYVRDDGVVAEGNCRTAVYLWLRETQKKEQCWKTIPAYRLPANITPRQIAVLQGHMHVAGKITWRKHEQAGHLHYMHTKLAMQPMEIATAMGMSQTEVELLLKSYDVMNELVLPRVKTGDGREKFSTVLELFKVGGMKEWSDKKANVKQFADLVVNGKVSRGQDVRAMPKIIADPRALEALKKEGFSKAISIVGKKDPTADSQLFKKLKGTAKALKTIRKPLIERLRTGKEEQQILKDLHSALKDFASAANVSL
ncbi:MAG TPA: hypothetical protein VK629_02330 [Steroidobacteraceae bacterium]|nr:hypothetical protein [Steroidobacteraceae bacterium]